MYHFPSPLSSLFSVFSSDSHFIQYILEISHMLSSKLVANVEHFCWAALVLKSVRNMLRTRFVFTKR